MTEFQALSLAELLPNAAAYSLDGSSKWCVEADRQLGDTKLLPELMGELGDTELPIRITYFTREGRGRVRVELEYETPGAP